MKATDHIHSKEAYSKKHFRHSVLASLHTIMICTMALVSFCFAWFTEVVSSSTPVVTGQTATYGIVLADVSSNGIVTGGDTEVSGGKSIAIEVETGEVYDFTLKGIGTATRYGGYCIVSAGDDVRYTERIYPEGTENGRSSLVLRIWFKGTGSSRIEFLPHWGVYPQEILKAESMQTSFHEEEQNARVDEEYNVVHNGMYIVSDGDIMVSPGDSDSSEPSVKAQKGSDVP